MNWNTKARYTEAMMKVEYYAWCARRGHVLAGNDPLTGKPRKSLFDQECVEESKAAYIAMAKYWLGKAKKLRTL